MARGIKIRLDEEHTKMLSEIAEDFGGPSEAVREGIRMLADQRRRLQALDTTLGVEQPE